LLRLPFTAADMALDRLAAGTPPAPPTFIVGHPRSGTTHLHNLLAATQAWATVSPVEAALPLERRTLVPLLKRFIDPYLPATRLIDGVALGPDAPTEDEVGLANLAPQSYFHAIYFPRRFGEDYAAALLGQGPPHLAAARERGLQRYVRAMAHGDPRPLLLKNPAYTAQVDMLFRLFPDARVIHIHRHPHAVFDSTRRMLKRVLDELGLQRPPADLDAVVLDTYPRIMGSLRAAVPRLPVGRFAEVALEDVVADPVGSVSAIAARLGLDDLRLDGLERYCRSLPPYRSSCGDLSRADAARVDHHWAPEIRTYGRVSGAASG
jgi:hypothetical protein